MEKWGRDGKREAFTISGLRYAVSGLCWAFTVSGLRYAISD
jgi:hypothetical protein